MRCSSCHNEEDRKGGLDLGALAFDPEDRGSFAKWVKVHDRVAAGEMPPKEKRRPPAEALEKFIGGLASTLTTAERAIVARDGRATQRAATAAAPSGTG